jgi:hypothetical protein
MEIPRASTGIGESIYGATKVLPDYQAEPLEQQGLFPRDYGDEHDGAAHTIVLVAVAADGGAGPAWRPAR